MSGFAVRLLPAKESRVSPYVPKAVLAGDALLPAGGYNIIIPLKMAPFI